VENHINPFHRECQAPLVANIPDQEAQAPLLAELLLEQHLAVLVTRVDTDSGRTSLESLAHDFTTDGACPTGYQNSLAGKVCPIHGVSAPMEIVYRVYRHARV